MIINTDLIYPIGSIYLSVNATNPSKYFGGTWVAWGTGRVPVGVDTTQTEFNAVEKTGGSKYIQQHKHSFRVVKDQVTASDGELPKANDKAGRNSGWTSYKTDSGVGSVTDVTTGNSGNLQPYITCYMWKRTAQTLNSLMIL